MNLRPYQTAAIEECRSAVRSGARSPLLVSPTGSGKTVMLSTIVSSHVAKGGRVNWFAHRRELVSQAHDTLLRFGLPVAGPDSPVRVLSVQGTLAAGEVPAATMCILDEAHHMVSDEWSRLVEAHKSAITIGATATPERGDGRGLGVAFDRLVVVAQVRELVDQGHLVPCEVRAPSRTLKRGQIARRPVDAYQQETPGRKAVCFAPNVETAVQYATEFRMAGIPTGCVTGDMPVALRDQTLGDFRSGKLRVLSNCFVLTEGWDCPDCDVVIIARGCGSAGMYLQMVGRAMRPAPGKTNAVLLDLRGVVHIHGAPDDERQYSLDGTGIMLASRAVGERFCKVCGAPLGDETTCAECGKQVELERPKATGDPLQKFAGIRNDTADQRVARIAKWIAEGNAKGYKTSWARFKAKAVYGHMPDGVVWAQAMTRAREMRP